ncbi:MAG: hypothetical protein PHE48_04870 [Candidatus Daviesbacteria bacterium]|nr:hypothetical protein [Candidatus Daviesbacteria bacterium]
MSSIGTERVIIVGDITDIRPKEISDFVKRANSLCGGIYPNREQNLPDTEMVKRTRALLTAAGVPDSLPIILCSSPEERARQILENLSSRRAQNGEGSYWIIDRNPSTLLAAVKSMTDSNNPLHADILKSITVIGFGAAFDHLDPATGIRITILPRPFYPFPTHPTPAS